MGIEKLFGGVYKGKVCLVTGDSGFKGSWLVHWLIKMDAVVIGYSLKPSTQPNHHSIIDNNYTSIIGDINDSAKLQEVFAKYKPEVVFHLAAQALVKYSYDNPIETLQTNIIGTANVFEASRKSSSVKAIINITSDKCYDNKEWIWGYRENDPMGGYDPYSASKGCSELLTSSYQKSYFNQGNKLLASARAGNVIGGGDWATDRLIPDIIRATEINEAVSIRNPYATRPWQHVLEPLSGYLMLGWKLLDGETEFAEGWNFGPELDNNVSVKTVIEKAKKLWSKIEYVEENNGQNHHEANLLMLDCSKAIKILKWEPIWTINQTLEKTIKWYIDYYENNQLNTDFDLEEYVALARAKSLIWTK